MNVVESAKELLRTTKLYQEMLQRYSLEDFQKRPSNDAWSLSEVYSHIIQVNTVSLMCIEKCFHGKQTTLNHILPFISRVILFVGRFPPVRLKAPDNIASQVKKIDLEEARNGLIKLQHRIEAVVPKFSKISSNCRINHPRLGMLNSEQWLRFMEIHNNHHLKQITRIQKSLNRLKNSI